MSATTKANDDTWRAGMLAAVAMCRRHTNATTLELADMIVDEIEDRDTGGMSRWRSTKMWSEATEWKYPLDRPVGDKKHVTITVSVGGNNIFARNVTGSPRRFDRVSKAMLWLRPDSVVPSIITRNERIAA